MIFKVTASFSAIIEADSEEHAKNAGFMLMCDVNPNEMRYDAELQPDDIEPEYSAEDL